MTYENFKALMDKMDELSLATKDANHRRRIMDEKMKLAELMPMPTIELRENWMVPFHSMIDFGARFSLVHPFKMVEVLSGLTKDSSDFDKVLDRLKRVMHEYIDMRCPKII